jgi:dTDP-4-dehydrorhamnose reductase
MAERGRLLVLGASGFVGRHLYARLGSARAVATWHSTPLSGGVRFDAGTMSLRDTLLRGRHGLTAAILLLGRTKIDDCARDPQGTAQVNVAGTIRAIDDLMEAGVKPVYASTDAVFDGSRGGWTEDDPPNPTLVYGRQNAAVEAHLRGKASPWIVARLSKVVGADDSTHSLIGEWLRQIEADETIRCARDLVFTPAHVDDVAAALVRLAEGAFSGVFNVCGPQSMTRLELLEILVGEIRRYRDVRPRIVPCSIRDFPFLEPRPLDGSMLPAKLYRALGSSFRDMRSVCAEIARNRYGDPAAAGRTDPPQPSLERGEP